jgi:hypothetical protein
MKLRFRGNSLRLRVNQKEVDALASGRVLKETVDFPGNTTLSYLLKTAAAGEPQALFAEGSIQITTPRVMISGWAASDDVGLYFTLPTGNSPLQIAIEKDLVCIDGPPGEVDPDAFPRELVEKVC